MEFIGWLGSVMLASCGIPQAIQCVRHGNANGLSNLFLIAWGLGEVFTFVYIISFEKLSWPLIFNYAINMTVVFILLKYKYFPRNENNITGEQNA